jgi:hypothetical protein
MVLDHRLRAHDPLRVAKPDEGMTAALLDESPVELERAAALVAA